MRRIALIAMFLSAACSTVPPMEPDPPVRGETPGHTCRDDGLSSFVGREATAETGAEILRQSGARTLRWIPQGSAVTMDFRTDRVNVRLDGQNGIESVSCG